MPKNNVIQISDFTRKQIDLAAKRYEEGDYIGALNVANYVVKKERRYEAYRVLAKVYMDIYLVRLAAGCWFKFLDTCPVKDRPEAYNGLGACFYLMDNYHLAGYYYDLQLTLAPDAEYDYLDEKLDYFETLSEPYRPEFYISYPLEKVPTDKRIELAEDTLYEKGKSPTVKYLKSIPKEDQNYVGAQLRLSAHYIILNKPESAKKVLNGLIRAFPEDPLPVINKFVLLAGMGNVEEALTVYDSLNKFDLHEFHQCNKIAVTCMEINKEEFAIDYALRAIEEEPYSVSTLFLLGAANFNLAKYDEALKYFTIVYQITDYEVAAFYLEMAENPPENPKPIGYRMRFPDNVAMKKINKVFAYLKKMPAITSRNLPQILKLCDWLYSFDNEMQKDFAVALLNTRNKKILKYFLDLLLVTEVEDNVKYRIVSELVYLGYDMRISAVYNGVYVKFKLIPFENTAIDSEWESSLEESKDIVKRAYALAFSMMSALIKSDLKKLKISALSVLNKLTKNGNIDKIEDIKPLAACIVVLSDNTYARELGILAGYFGTEKRKINTILKLIKDENG